MNKFHFLLLAALAISVVGCNKDASSAESKSASPAKVVKIENPEKLSGLDFIITEPGSQVTYEVVGTNRDITFKTTAVTGSDDSKIVTYEVIEAGKVADSFKWKATKNGLSQTSARKGIPFEPEQVLLKLPFTAGEEFKYDGKGAYPSIAAGEPASGPLESISKVRGIEVVDTALGKIEAIAVQSVTVYAAGEHKYREEATTWFSPKYGIVRYVQSVKRSDGREVPLRLRLKSLSTK